MDDKNFGLNNPKQIADAIQNKQLVINANFQKITESNLRNGITKNGEVIAYENSPLKIFGVFSRFSISILDNGTSVTTNLKIEDIAGIKERTDFAAKLCYEAEMNKSNKKMDANKSYPTDNKAYTVRFTFGDYKGKTPAMVKDELGEKAKDALNNQYKAYKSKLSEHPENQAVVDALIEAAKLTSIDKELIKEMNALFAKEESKLAFEAKFTAGNLRGKSPAQVIIEATDKNEAVTTLNNQKDYLAKNVDKYPNNKKIISGIEWAIKMFNDGTIETTDNIISTSFEIIKELPKPNTHGGAKMVNNVEMFPTTSLGITCNPDAKYPISVIIKKYNCPVKKTETGGLNALVSQMDKDSYVVGEITLSIDKWCDLVSQMQRQIDIFSIMNGNEMLKLSEKIDAENRNNAS